MVIPKRNYSGACGHRLRLTPTPKIQRPYGTDSKTRDSSLSPTSLFRVWGLWFRVSRDANAPESLEPSRTPRQVSQYNLLAQQALAEQGTLNLQRRHLRSKAP